MESVLGYKITVFDLKKISLTSTKVLYSAVDCKFGTFLNLVKNYLYSKRNLRFLGK